MRSSSWVGWAAITVVVAGVVAAVVAAWAGTVLAADYQPHAAGAGLPVVPPGVGRSDSWSDWHRAAIAVFLASTIGVGAIVARLGLSGEHPMPRRAVAVGCSAVAAGAAVVTSLTRGMIEWDQVGLRSVTVGSDTSGYWFAAFNDDVRFVIVGDSRVSQGRYAAALIAHLGAPVVGAAALVVIAWVLVTRARRVGS